MRPGHVVLGGVIALALVPFGGRWVPAFDSFAIVAPYLAAALILWALVRRRAGRLARSTALGAGLVALLPLASVALPGPSPQGDVLYLLQHNIHFRNDGTSISDHLKGFEIATLQEIQAAERVFDELPPDWAAATCPRPRDVSTAVLSRLPMTQTGCLSGGEAWARLDTPLGPVTVVSLHLYWPWPTGNNVQADQVDALAKQLDDMPGPLLLAGDLNQMPWSATASKLARASNASIVGGLRSTFHMAAGLIRLPIDHVFIPEGWTATASRSGAHGSDHMSVAVTLGLTLP